jgi:tRNA G26 N,N-dimethylase Trm1
MSPILFRIHMVLLHHSLTELCKQLHLEVTIPCISNASLSKGHCHTGLLCVTCTDMAVLAGSQSEACWAKYGGMSLPQSQYCHELALRILLHSIQSSAARYRRWIEPLASCSIDFYVRIFIRVHDSASMVRQAARFVNCKWVTL